MRNLRLDWVLTLAAFVALSACGGGDGGGGGGEPPPPPGNQPPVASFVVTPTSGTVPMAVTVDAAQSRDPDGSVVRYAWDFGDGETSDAGSFLTHVYRSQADVLTVTLTVTDNAGATATTTRQVSATANDLSGPVAITLVAPDTGLVPDDVQVIARVTGTYEINRVTARLAGQELELRYDRYGNAAAYFGTFSLAGQGLGPLPLEVQAVDARGNVDVLTVSVVHDNPPRIDWIEPVDFSVALPTVPLDVRCIDDLPGCTLLVLDQYGTLQQGGSPQTGTLDLTPGIGRRDIVQVWATDRSGQITRASRTLYPENPARLELLAEVPGRVLDTDLHRLLFVVKSAEGNRLAIHDRSTGGTEDIPLPEGWELSPAAPPPELVSGGAIFTVDIVQGAIQYSHAYFWKQGVLNQMGGDSARFAWVADPYALYTSGDERRLLDTSTGSSRRILGADYAAGATVTPDGTVVFPRGPEIVRDDDGVQTIVARDDQQPPDFPLLDGETVVYSGATNEIRLVERGIQTSLSGSRPYDVRPPLHYQVRQGWVAYTDTGDSGIVHVYTKDPAGVVSRRTDLNVSIWIELLGEGGALMVASPQNHSRYFTRGASPTYVSSDTGRSYQIDGRWYVSIGRSLLAVDTSE